MTVTRYNRIWGICFAIVIASAFIFDMTPAKWHWISGVVAIIATLVTAVNHYRFRFPGNKKDE